MDTTSDRLPSGREHRAAARSLAGLGSLTAMWLVTIIGPSRGRSGVLWPALERFAGITP